MAGPRKILVAVDFSPHSEAALEEAFALAEKFGAVVDLVHVYTLQDKPESQVFSATEDEAREAERRQLEALADACKPSGRLGEVLWAEGDPAPGIVLTARRRGADLIVLGACGRSVWKRLLLGSVAQGVVKDAGCSVLVVRSAALGPPS